MNSAFKTRRNKPCTSFFLIFIFLLAACDAQNTRAQKRVTGSRETKLNTTSMITYKLLEKQVALGSNPSQWGFNAADQEDLNVSLSLQDSILEKTVIRRVMILYRRQQLFFI